MFNRHIAKAIADFAVFLEFADEDVLDPDASMQAMEQLAAELQSMSEDERRALSTWFGEIASDYGGREAFVRDLSETLGLA
ncbi:hypothetical protein ACIP1U_19405 [Cupriavidus sp. NPDC089707]|uniref:hypothetical protein n=1 Tax=Cupriavidus sp. NPDC089707 TaxID=3363963 RepID=UPI0038092971